jgi:hypothetical protein
MALSIKFPIGSRVSHTHGGPATVTGYAFKGADGTINLPVKFDNPDKDDGSRGWYECNFTLIEPESQVGGRCEVRVPYQYHLPFVDCNPAHETEVEHLKQRIDKLESDLRFARSVNETYVKWFQAAPRPDQRDGEDH